MYSGGLCYEEQHRRGNNNISVQDFKRKCLLVSVLLWVLVWRHSLTDWG
uniref:Uncharacterized protein n=1 Tax=Anguilla anguilla TaxID=7936 RepID=A0A0E9WBS7_ANGAN